MANSTAMAGSRPRTKTKRGFTMVRQFICFALLLMLLPERVVASDRVIHAGKLVDVVISSPAKNPDASQAQSENTARQH